MNWILLTFFYILPAILTALTVYHMASKVTRGDLIGIILFSLIPVINWFGYVAGLAALCQSKTVQDFFNTRIK
jgi:hypothetical protein